jgi:hypothetical protein
MLRCSIIEYCRLDKPPTMRFASLLTIGRAEADGGCFGVAHAP